MAELNEYFGTKSLETPEKIEKFWHKTMKNKKYIYDYANINVRAEVVRRFRAFSKKVAHSHAETLTAMMDFFEWHNYSPYQRFGKDVIAGQKKNRQRIDAVIAIIKSVEKSQNIPLINIETMLKSLFQGEVKKYEPKLIEPKPGDSKKSINQKERTTISRMEHDRANTKLTETKDRLRYVLERVELVSNRFGKDFLKIEITREELARFKQSLKNE
ncbi:BfmA/BtgA family mobilization protein [Eudoraea sp.]|uniref:BfmA/BtgA family mobilization protein n=1 Tax=Eudoraea sp. TaxID=1979955 RepID=UPI003C71A6AD